MIIDSIQFKNAVRLLAGGFIYDQEASSEHDYSEVVTLLREIAQDYEDEIKLQLESLENDD